MNALIFRRYFWVVNGVFILLAALLVANTVNLFVEDALLPPLPGAESSRQPGATLAKAREDAGTPLDAPRLAKLTGLTLRTEPDVKPPEGPLAEEGLVRSSLRVKLLGTLLSNEEQWSTASLQDLDSHRARSVRVGDELLGARVVSIERKRVIVANNGRDEFIDGEGQPGMAPSVPARLPPGGGSPPAVSDASGIRATGEHSYEIPSTELQGALSRLDQLTTQARAMPAMENGQVVGFKLAAIRQGSLYTKIGLQNGDVLRRINGLTLDSPEKALEAFAKLRESKHIQLDIDRGGAPVRKFYNVM